MSEPRELVATIRAICVELPGTTEKLSHGAVSFFAGKQYAAVRPDGHHGDPRPQLWCPAPPGVQDELVEDDPDRFFRPPYVGGRGWIGVVLTAVDTEELAAILTEAHAVVTT